MNASFGNGTIRLDIAQFIGQANIICRQEHKSLSLDRGCCLQAFVAFKSHLNTFSCDIVEKSVKPSKQSSDPS